MHINIWECKENNLWHWTVCDGSRPILKQESGKSDTYQDAMNDVDIIMKKMRA